MDTAIGIPGVLRTTARICLQEITTLKNPQQVPTLLAKGGSAVRGLHGQLGIDHDLRQRQGERE